MRIQFVLPKKGEPLTNTTMVQHETKKTTTTKITSRRQELPIITSPGPSFPFGHFSRICSAPIKLYSNFKIKYIAMSFDAENLILLFLISILLNTITFSSTTC